ncbi:MAG: ABC transporter permease [SAR324 cluster bacterium]|nr:ABC transporter permease [SAR324 cluster bacterium]MBL7034828.1 ABC transporter permease [SAR324 cluster bacterium]
MIARWISWRIIREIMRDRRTLAFFFLVPLVVMSLIYYALQEDETARLGVVSRGVMRLFEADLMLTLEEEDIELVSLDIPDEEVNPELLEKLIWAELRTGNVEGVLFLGEQLLEERFDGKRGRIDFYLEGSRPTLTAAVLESVSSAMDDLAASLPVVIDSSCSAFCANSVNIKPLDLEEHYLYGSADYRLIDFFLPVFPPFFVFFFTFLITTITFQRERIRGTLERLLIAPVSFTQIILGYIGGFIIFSGCQAAIILTFILSLIGFEITLTQIGAIAFLTLLMLLISLVLGLLASFLAANEFQAVQFIPLVILPQIFLSDMIWSIDSFPVFFQWISQALPLTHANIAMRNVLLKQQNLWESWPQLLTLSGFFLAILLLLVFVSNRQKNSA